MEKPNYVLDTEEAVIFRKPQEKDQVILKTVLLVIVAGIIIASIVLQQDILAEIGWIGKGILIVVVGGLLLKRGKKIYSSSPLEIQFYEDYMIINRSIHKLNSNTQKQVDKLKYSEITKCSYHSKSQKMKILGNTDHTFYQYNTEANASIDPVEHEVKKSKIKFSLKCAPFTDIVNQFETNSPLKISVS